VDDLNDLDNVAVLTACQSNETATTDLDAWESYEDYYPEDMGSEWTSSLLEAFASIVSDRYLYYLIQNYATEV